MQEHNSTSHQDNAFTAQKSSAKNEKAGTRSFFSDMAKGALMGIAFIIPGFSGGSVAAILGIYEKLITAIADIFKSFKKSFMTLLPIILGLACGVIALLFPLGWALESYPIPTVCLFVGLAIGGLPSVTDKLDSKFKPTHTLSLLIPTLVAVSLCFLPIAQDANLLALDVPGHLLLIIIGIIGSAALVVPGISGSMLLLILGYYNPIVNIMTDHLLKGQDVLTSLLVLGCTGLGICIGFIGISLIMKWLLAKCPYGTHLAIIGFIVGSIPTVYVSTAKDAGITFATLPKTPGFWIASVLLLALGLALSLGLIFFAKKKAVTSKAND